MYGHVGHHILHEEGKIGVEILLWVSYALWFSSSIALMTWLVILLVNVIIM